MKVYNKIVYDKDDNIIEEHSYDYNGPVAQARLKKGPNQIKNEAKGYFHKGSNIESSVKSKFQTRFSGRKKIIENKSVNLMDEVALTGGATIATDANDGFVSMTQSDSDAQPVFKRKLIPNPLHDFATVNHVITLAILDAQEINFTGVVVKNGPKYPVAQTAGRVGRDPTAFGSAGLNLEMLIDNLNVEAVVAPTPQNRTAQATNITFEVIEPFSIGVFFQAMKIQAIKAYGPDADYLTVPFALIIDFKGYDDDGNVARNDQNLRQLRRVIPIGMRNVEMTANHTGGRYSCQAYPWNEMGLRDAFVSIKQQVTLTGTTVHELLQSGEDSLMNQINSIGSDKKAKQKKTKKDEKTEEIPHESTVVFFPDPFGVDNDTLVPSEEDIAALNEDRATRVFLHDESKQPDDYTTQFSTRKADKQLTTIFSTGQSGAINVSNFLGSAVGDGGGLRLNQGKGNAFFGNEIGKSKMLTAGTNPYNSKKFADSDVVYNKETKTYDRGKSQTSFLDNKITMKFEKGTKVTDIIENVILFSEYGQSIGKAHDGNKQRTPFVPWFRIHPQCWQLRDSFVRKHTGKDPVVFTYNVIPYEVSESMFVDPTDFPKGFDLLQSSVRKKYDYLYTGINKDILNFDINYRFTFFDQQRERPNVTSNTSDVGKGTRVETDVVAGKDSKFEFFPRSQTVVSAGSPQAIAEDNSSRASGLDADSPEVQVARQFNEKIVNSNVDLLQLQLRIIGDTYFLPNSGMGNLVVTDSRKRNSAIEFGEREMDYLNTQVHVEVNFNTPIDINEQTGDMNLGAIKLQEQKQNIKLGVFSAIYRVTKVRSEFVGGKFEQDLELVAPASMTLGQKETKSTSKATTKKTDTGDIKIENDGFIKSGTITDGVA